jgi:2-succinyl-5-enolpyruvyl-6-hydroxy-3-cyclohexene-1-carboxylate synthase
VKKPLVIIGGLAPRHRARVATLTSGAAVYAEALSGLRDRATITAGERMIARGEFDGVVRIGNVPTLRFWRDLETLELPVEHYSDLPFTGLTRGAIRPLDALPAIAGDYGDFFERDRELRARFEAILDDEPRSELAMIRALSRELPDGARVYLGNSLPIREWDLAAERRPFEFEANRGANGIDGQLSTFFGWCAPSRENVCVVGDLTAIYDLNAPWIVPQLEADTRFRIVIVNNGGGRIFSRVASLRALDPSLRERIIENVHELRFDDWAAMWNIDVTELRPDDAASKRVWQRYDALWS